MTRPVPPTVLTAITLALALAPGRVDAGQRDGFRAEVQDRQTHTVRVGEAGLLSLSNMVGDVTVRRGDGPDTIIEVIRVARGRSEADARRGLAAVTARVSERGSGVQVEVNQETVRNAPYVVSVSYAVTAPASTDLAITSLTGNVRVTGLTGELSAVTTTGDVEVREAGRVTRARTTTGRVTLTNVDSDVAVDAGAISGAVRATSVRAPRLQLDTITGSVTARDITADRVEITTTQGELIYEGRIAPAGRYDLRTHSGAVTFVSLGGSGFDLRAQTYAGQVVVADDMGLVVRARNRRELSGSVGDGRALVFLTTFSGQVSIAGRRAP